MIIVLYPVLPKYACEAFNIKNNGEKQYFLPLFYNLNLVDTVCEGFSSLLLSPLHPKKNIYFFLWEKTTKSLVRDKMHEVVIGHLFKLGCCVLHYKRLTS